MNNHICPNCNKKYIDVMKWKVNTNTKYIMYIHQIKGIVVTKSCTVENKQVADK